MSQFNIDEIEKRTLSGLKDFQRATVERVDYLRLWKNWVNVRRKKYVPVAV
mgnify:CR=1 FL=1